MVYGIGKTCALAYINKYTCARTHTRARTRTRHRLVCTITISHEDIGGTHFGTGVCLNFSCSPTAILTAALTTPLSGILATTLSFAIATTFAGVLLTT